MDHIGYRALLTTSGLAKELVKQGVVDERGMVAFGRFRERFGKTAREAKLTEFFQFRRTSDERQEDKWMKWAKLMRQVSETSVGDGRS